MTRPVPAPKTPRPIRDTPNAGQWSVVVSFRLTPGQAAQHLGRQKWERLAEDAIGDFADGWGLVQDMHAGIRVHGAGGERSEDEGRWDRPSVVANTDDVEHDHPTSDVPTGGKT